MNPNNPEWYHHRISEAIKAWKASKASRTQKSLAIAANMDPARLSNSKGGGRNPTYEINILTRQLKEIEKVLVKEGYFYDSIQESYCLRSAAVMVNGDQLPKQLVGVYELYNLNSTGTGLSKCILYIKGNGSTAFRDPSGFYHKGSALLFRRSQLSIFFQKTGDEDLPQLINCNVGVVGGLIDNVVIEGVFTSWERTNLPFAGRSILIKCDIDPQKESDYQPDFYILGSKPYLALKKQPNYDRVLHRLTGILDNTLLAQKQETSSFKFKQEEKLGNLYFDAACQAASRGELELAEERLKLAVLHGMLNLQKINTCANLQLIFRQLKTTHGISSLVELQYVLAKIHHP